MAINTVKNQPVETRQRHGKILDHAPVTKRFLDHSLVGRLCVELGRERSSSLRWTQLVLDVMRALGRKEPTAIFTGQTTFLGHDGVWVVEPDWRLDVMLLGQKMENITETLSITREELEAAKEDLEGLANELAAVADIIEPALIDQTRRIRAARITAVDETRQALTALRELRAFFSEAGYTKEIERMEHFVAICQQFKKLKDEGLLDAVVDMTKRI